MQLTYEERSRAIRLLEKGYSSRKVARELGNIAHTTILRLKKKYEKTGNIKNKKARWDK